MSAEDLTVVIPTRGRPAILRRTLEALERQTASGFEVVVVADGLDQELPDLPPFVRVLRQEHAGPGAARNRAVARSGRPLLLFLADDMIPRPRTVERHLARHAAAPDPAVGVLGRIVWHADVPRDRLHRWLAWSDALFDQVALERDRLEEAGWYRFVSSNVSLKRELFDAVGGFDEDFVFDYEDLDFAWRASQHELRLLYEREAVTEHLHPYDWPAVVRRYAGHAPAERLMAAKHEWFSPWFRDRLEEAASRPLPWRGWPLLADLVPGRPARLRAAVRARADRWYLRRLAPPFRDAWERAGG